MKLNDNGRKYDTDKMDSYSLNTHKLITRLVHLRYAQKVKLVAIRKAIQEEKNINRIKNVFGYSLEEINFYIDYAEQNIPMVR